MTLAAPVWLWLLAMAPLIVILHLRRHHPVQVPSVRLWQLVAEGSDRSQRLRRPPATASLLLQLLILALAALTLAEPNLGRADDTREHVLILDAGAPMGVTDTATGSTRFATALEAWLSGAEAARVTGPVSVWWVGPWTRPLAVDLVDLAAVRTAMAGVAPSDGAADWGSAAVKLAGVLQPGSQVTVITAEPSAAEEALTALVRTSGADLTVSSVAGAFWDLRLESVSVVRVGKQPAQTPQSTSAVSASPTTPPLATWSIAGAVSVVGEPPAKMEAVEVSIGFLPEGTSTVLPFWSGSVRFNQGGRAPFDAELELPGSGHLEVKIVEFSSAASETGGAASLAAAAVGPDSYDGDDARWVRLQPDPPAPRAVVVTGLGAASPTAKALVATGAYEVEVVSHWPTGVTAALAVVESSPDPFVGVDPALRPAAVLWMGSSPGATVVPVPRIDPSVTSWDHVHPASSGTNWSSLDTARANILARVDGTESLVTGVASDLVQARASGTGRDLLVAFDPRDTTWTASTQFLTFVSDATSWLAPAPQSVSACHVGLPCRLPWDLASSGPSAQLDGRIAWWLPAWQDGPLPSTIDDVWRPDASGLWEVGPPGGPTSLVAVQPTQGAALSIEKASRSSTGALATPFLPGAVSLTRLLVLLLVTAIVVESLIAGRGSERFWQREALLRGGASGVRSRRTAAGHIVVLAIMMLSLVQAPWPTFADQRTLVVIAPSPIEATAALPAGYAAWPDRLRVDVPLLTPDGAVDGARALEMAAAAVVPGAPARIVVVPPSPLTRSLATPLLATLRSGDISVDSLPIPASMPGDVAVTSLAPTSPPLAGSSFALHAVVTAVSPRHVELRLEQDGITVSETDMDLLPGTTLVTVPVEGTTAGTLRFALTATTDSDPEPRNDTAEVLVEVRAAPSVLLYAAASSEADSLADAFELQGFTVAIRPPHTMGIEPGAYFGYDSVVLLDVPAIDISSAQQEALELWVRDFGGGLVIVGGEHAFGPGGYLETALDRVSPLSSRVPREAPEVAMLFVLDRSGSMQQTVGSTTRLDVAKQATLTAISLLGEGSKVAIVAYDDTAHTLLEFTSSSDLDSITSAIAPLVPGGGTAVLPALEAASQLLLTTDSASRHVVVLTDGLSQPDDITAVMAQLVDSQATVSAIAIGVGSDVERVREIAGLGGGTAHITADFRALPSILAQEAMLLAGDPVVRETVVPSVNETGMDLMAGLPSKFPPLASFVETTPKDAATVHLADEEERPLLASWRYGSGRVLAFTSQAVGSWARAWTEVSEFPSWWGQWLRWTVQPSGPAGLDLSTSVIGDEVVIEVTASAPDGSPLQGLELLAAIRSVTDAANDATKASVALSEIERGRYLGTLPLAVGDSRVTVTALGQQDSVPPVSRLVAHAYLGALSPAMSGHDQLAGLRAGTGGQLLEANDEPWPGTAGQWSTARLFRPWLVLMLIVWGLTLFIRYVPVRWRGGWLRSRRGASAHSPASA